jgi:hypothetical protein
MYQKMLMIKIMLGLRMLGNSLVAKRMNELKTIGANSKKADINNQPTLVITALLKT